MIIKIHHIDTLEYLGTIIAKNPFDYELHGIKDEYFLSVTKGMPLKALLSNLVAFNMVYDIIDDDESAPS